MQESHQNGRRIQDFGNIRPPDHVPSVPYREGGAARVSEGNGKNVARILGQLVDILMRKKQGPR